MSMTGSRLRQIGWGAVLAVCVAAFIILSVTVHAVRNEVVLAERTIISLKKKKQKLETEFQARASQHQLARWNRVDLGYQAPRADQYLDSRRELAKLGQDTAPGAPAPVRLARVQTASAKGQGAGTAVPQREMVSPITGQPVTLAAAQGKQDSGSAFTEAFNDFLVEASPIRPANAQTTTREPSE